MGKTAEIHKRYNEFESLLSSTPDIEKRIELSMRDFGKRDIERGSCIDRVTSEARAAADILLSFKRYRDLRDLRNSMKGRIALLLGNGPSCDMLNWDSPMMSSDQLDIAVVNFFKAPPERLNHKIKIIGVTDPLVFQSQDQENSLPTLEGKQKELIKRISRLQNPFLFCNRSVNRQVDKRKVPGVTPITFSDHFSSLFGGVNPLYPKSYMSMNIIKIATVLDFLGYDQTLLCGSDNDFIKKFHILPNNSIAVEQTYNGEDSQLDPLTQAPKSYYGAIRELELAWQKIKGLNVLNLDPLSLTAAFRKVSPCDYYFGLLRPEFQERINILSKRLSW